LVKRKRDTKQLIELPAVSFYGLLILKIPIFIKILNTAMKNGEYEPDIFFQTTSKDLDPLWQEYIQFQMANPQLIPKSSDG